MVSLEARAVCAQCASPQRTKATGHVAKGSCFLFVWGDEALLVIVISLMAPCRHAAALRVDGPIQEWGGLGQGLLRIK